MNTFCVYKICDFFVYFLKNACDLFIEIKRIYRKEQKLMNFPKVTIDRETPHDQNPSPLQAPPRHSHPSQR